MATEKKFIPVTLRSDQLKVLIIGGGEVALRKINSLAGNVRSITVVAPLVKKEIQARSDVTVVQRAYLKSDLEGADILFVAVDDKTVSAVVAEDIKGFPNLLCNFVDNPDASHFFTPASIRKENLILSLSSGGKAPGLLPELKREIEKTIDLDKWSQSISGYEQTRSSANGNL